MPICINCSHPLPHLYTIYSKADDRTLGKGVRLTQCTNCKRFADKYVEHDYVVLFIDLVLIKPQVYRHLLFNRLGNTGVRASANNSDSSSNKSNTTPQRHDRLDPSIARLGILLVLFDVYITWARIEKGSNSGGDREGDGGVLANWPILGQYLFFLTLNLLSTVAQHGVIRLLARYFFSRARQVTGSAPSGADGWSHGHSLGHGHSRSSSTATERPKDRDRDAGAGSTTTTATTTSSPAAVLRKISSQNSPHLHQHDSHSRFSHGSPTPAHENIANTHTTAAHGPGHAEHNLLSSASPHRIPPSGSAISTALLVSSCTKLFPILLVIWPTTGGSTDSSPSSSSASPYGDSSLATAAAASAGPFGSRAASYIGWVVLFNNIEALMILLQPDSGYVGVTALAVAGFVVRFVVEGCLLSTVSLAMDGSGPVGDFLSLLVWVKGRILG